MDAILMSLMAALNEQLLINIYQRDTEDFYTGYVQALGKNSVLVATYNDAGLADGAVLISFVAISQVEFAGADLEDMTFRMRVAAQDHFKSLPATKAPLHFDATRDLTLQLATQVQKSGQLILVMLADDDAYLEGQVTAVDTDRLTLSVFNKFNYTDVRVMQVDFSDVLVIEFQGLELHLETALQAGRDQLKHLPTQIHQNDGQLQAVLATAQTAGTLVAVMPKGGADQFYVGRVLALNAELVVLRLKDMAGQFGGYVALRLTGLQTVTTQSDYLQTIAFYSRWVAAHDMEKQPVLNADREFDASGDLIASLIQSAAAFDRVVRVRGKESGDQLMGVPENVTATGFTMHADDTDEDVPFTFATVQELAFGHIYAYLQEARMRQ
ncbi:hypothetical protein [Lacticaseibacillus suihuaensis]